MRTANLLLLATPVFFSLIVSLPQADAKSETKAQLNKPVSLTVEYASAIEKFNSGRYSAALASFRPLVDDKSIPADKLHYYMAICNHKLNQVVAARHNYEYVVSHSKDQSLRIHANSALKNLDRYEANRKYLGQGNSFVADTNIKFGAGPISAE